MSHFVPFMLPERAPLHRPGGLSQFLDTLAWRLKRRPSSQERALRQAMEAVDQGVVRIGLDGAVTVLNRRAAQMLDLPPNIVGRPLLHWQADTRLEKLHDVLHPGEGMCETRRPDGSVLEIRSSRLPGGALLRTLTDVTQSRAAAERIQFLAHHDPLTGFINRGMFERAVQQAARRGGETGQQIAVMLLHLDRFKQVNDMKGHATGDDVLLMVARRLRAMVREGDVVARIGGDEFAVLIAEDGQVCEPVAALARRLHTRITAPYQVGGSRVAVGCSIGVAEFPHDAEDAPSLMKQAGVAMYCANRGGHGGVRFHEAGMDAERSRRVALEEDLHRALERGQFRLVYQPVFDTASGAVTSCEALLRWRHPEHGEVSPGEFIPIAESCGLILPIGAWVLRQACREAASWPQGVAVAVNLSPAQFWAPDLIATIDDALEQACLAPNRLALEVTEGLMIDDPGRALHTMHEFRARGIGLWLDDFGTGHASLSYLRRFPFEKIKIDRSFIAALGNDEPALAIVQAIVALSRALDMKVVAEGVETQAQYDALRRLRCDQMQGFLLGRPTECDAIRDVLRPVPLVPVLVEKAGAEPVGAALLNFPEPRLAAR